MPDHAPACVVAHDDDETHPVADRRVDLHEVKAEGAVSGEQGQPAFGMEQAGGDGVADTAADASEQPVIQQTVGLAHRPAQLNPRVRVASVRDDDVVLAVQVIIKLTD